MSSVLADLSRWSPPKPIPISDDTMALCNHVSPAPIPLPALMWGATYNNHRFGLARAAGDAAGGMGACGSVLCFPLGD
eukprot:3896805-Alexandrium_andersonii.AAC.1